jgi:hypothetical protein
MFIDRVDERQRLFHPGRGVPDYYAPTPAKGFNKAIVSSSNVY